MTHRPDPPGRAPLAPRRIAPVHLATLLACATGCASMRPALTAPEQGGPPWVAVVTTHIRLTTDLPEARARQAAAQFEADWAAVEQAFRFTTGVTATFSVEPIDVVAFERPVDFHAIEARHIGGSFVERRIGPDVVRRVIVPADDEYDMRKVVRHELTHRLVGLALPRAPIWLNEGLAEYLETLQPRGSELVLGAQPREFGFDLDGRLFATRSDGHWGFVEGAAIPPLRALVAATATEFLTRRGAIGFNLHAGSWLLVRSLAVGAARERLTRYVALLLDRTARPDAWDRAFGDLPQLEADYARTYVRQDAHVTLPWREPSEAAVAVEALVPAAVHLEWARLHALTPAHEAQAIDEVNRALAASPDWAEAHCLVAMLEPDPARALDHAERAFALAPNVARHPLVIGSLLLKLRARGVMVDAGRVVSLFRAAAARSPTPDQAAAIGQFHYKSGRHDEALALSEAALQADPRCVPCLALRMELAVSAHDNDLTRDLIERLLPLVADEKVAAELREASRRLR